MKCRRLKVCLAISFYCLALWMIGITAASGQSEHTAKLIEGAKKEGKLVWYTSISIPVSRGLLDAFERKYPFVETDLVRASGERIINRILTETRAGAWKFDVAAMSGLNILVQDKLLSTYISPERKAYPSKFKEPEGYWTGIYNNYYVIGYNTALVSQAEAPKGWEDLLDPKWKGKIAIDQEEYAWYAALLAAWGEEKTQKYMKALAKQQIQWRKGHTLIAQLMAAGEFPVAIVYAHGVETMKKKAAPIDWVNTLDPVVASVGRIGLSSKPNNPNTAKLFIDFVLSKEGQQLIVRSSNRVSTRIDVAPSVPSMDRTKLKLELVPLDRETRFEYYVRQFKHIFGL